MRYKTHIVSSLTLGVGLSIIFNYPFHFAYVIGISFGSLLPDIDEPKSYIGRRSFGIAKYVNDKYGHRGITHSLFAWVFISLIYVIYPSPLSLGISLGYLFHLLGDLFSIRSIPFLAPFSTHYFKLPFTYRTGSITEDILLYIFIFLLLYFVFILGELHIYLIQSTVESIVSFIRILIELFHFLLD
ncbi:metal-dependent hydrolase [Piscibacillus halophilus]|uniref:metal-dependent hydrolase n=1 Tax=Piscibacillus halophilus TaxID=571933 RepID=UPI00158AB7BA|nr:metal-dependent hydrolase [Piscibacillus halophilus]